MKHANQSIHRLPCGKEHLGINDMRAVETDDMAPTQKTDNRIVAHWCSTLGTSEVQHIIFSIKKTLPQGQGHLLITARWWIYPQNHYTS